ncbi:MAG: hypothetical protein POG74_10485 [Acidocella sp.]|nr:hypothetical protein [Acidocella sp.]
MSMVRVQTFCGLLLAGWCVFAATGARAADTAIMAAESTVRIGIDAGYGQYQEGSPLSASGTGALVGATLGASRLGFGAYRDAYADVEYDFSAGFMNGHGQAVPVHGTNTYNTVIVRLGLGVPLLGGAEVIPYVAGGYQTWNHVGGGAQFYGANYQAGLIGGGLRLDLTAGPAFVVSASVEGLAVIGGSITVPSEAASGASSTSAQERVSLDADYRLNSTWHAFAGLGLTHYSFTGGRAANFGSLLPGANSLQVSSTFGVAYGF